MNFKKPKEQVVSDARRQASGFLYSAFSDIRYNGNNQSMGSVIDKLQHGIEMAIGSAIESVVEDIYTDEEFEKDLTLKD